MRILVTGASGFIGNHLVQYLSGQGHEITACVRYGSEVESRLDSVSSIQCDFTKDTNIKDWLARLNNIEVVINCVGIIHETSCQQFETLHKNTPIALFKACEHAGIKRVIQISALGADESASSQYHLSKRAADDVLMSLAINWTIVMPSIVYGPGARSMAFFKAMASLPITPLIEDGDQKIQPIHIDDFSRAISQLVSSTAGDNSRIEFVGPKPVTMKQTFILLKKWLGMSTSRFLRVSYRVSLLLSRLANFMPGFGATNPLSKETIQMLNDGNSASVDLFEKTFGFQPVSLSDSLKYSAAQQADKWQAKLILLRPLLILSIAFIWIYTGIISAFVYPIESSKLLLQPFGIEGSFAAFTIYSTATIDIVLGVATLLCYRLRLIGMLQIAMIVAYTLLITLYMPEQWLHPFGPISKNIPLLVAILVMMSLEEN